MCRQPKFRASGFLGSSADPGTKSMPPHEPVLNFSASRILSSRDHFMTGVVFSKHIPEKKKTKLCAWSF